MSENKICIHTIVSDNFGNRLQNFALQSVLENFKWHVETIQRRKVPIGHIIKALIQSVVKINRWSLFRQFNLKYIHWSPYYVIGEGKKSVHQTLLKNYNKYAKFVIGSDQIWNVTFDFIGENDFLPFIPSDKKLSYAASFGVDAIPDTYTEKVRKWLSDIKTISVREKSGVELVKKLIDRKVMLVLDPTLLLSKDDWKKIEKRPRMKLPQKYSVTYFLGTEHYQQEIGKLCEGEQLTTINLLDRQLPVGPSEFVYLIHHAENVFTDSFHACVFSLLFEKTFVIFERKSSDKNMSSRITSFCDTFQLHDHRFSCNVFNYEACKKREFSKQKAILEKEKQASLSFLDSALKE